MTEAEVKALAAAKQNLRWPSAAPVQERSRLSCRSLQLTPAAGLFGDSAVVLPRDHADLDLGKPRAFKPPMQLSFRKPEPTSP